MMLSGCIPGLLPVTSCMVQNVLIFKKFILQNKKYWNEMTVGWFMFNQYTAKRLELVSISSLQTNKPHRCQCLTIYVILTRSCIKNIVWIGNFFAYFLWARLKKEWSCINKTSWIQSNTLNAKSSQFLVANFANVCSTI